DFEDAVGGLHPKPADGPHVALAGRRPQRHLPPREPAREPTGLPERGPDRQRQLLLPVHDRSQLPFESFSPFVPPASRVGSRPPSTLRTERASFPALRSSMTNAP